MLVGIALIRGANLHQQHVVVRCADIWDPLGWNAAAEQVGFREVGERPLELRCGCWFGGDVEGDLDLANRFADLDDLSCAGHGMGFHLAPRSPVVSGIVMAHVAEHHAALDPVEDQPYIAAGTGRPEVLVRDVVEMVALQAWIGRVDLQFEGSELGRLLIFSIELIQAGLEAVGKKKRHGIKMAAAATRCSEGLALHGSFHQRSSTASHREVPWPR